MNMVAVGVFMSLLLFFSDSTMDAASRAASVFVQGVMPALFPMMIIGQLSRLSATAHQSSRIRVFLAATLFSFAAGSPASTQRARQLEDQGLVDPPCLLPLLAATGVMSPMFFLGTIANWTGLKQAPFVMLLIHWLSALICATIIFLPKYKETRTFPDLPNLASNAPKSTHSPPRNILSALPVAISSSAQALLGVCGAMMLFSIIAALIRALLNALLPQWTAAHPEFLAVLWAMLEIGGGASEIIATFPTPPLALLCALCSFGGLSIWIQNLLFIGQSIRPAKLLPIRMLHGAISYGICHLVFSLFPVLSEAFAQPPTMAQAYGNVSPLIPVLLMMLVLFGFTRRRSLAS